MVYGAQTIKKLKERFSQYESMKQKARRAKTKAIERNNKPAKTDYKNKKTSGEGEPNAVIVKRCFQ